MTTKTIPLTNRLVGTYAIPKAALDTFLTEGHYMLIAKRIKLRTKYCASTNLTSVYAPGNVSDSVLEGIDEDISVLVKP